MFSSSSGSGSISFSSSMLFFGNILPEAIPDIFEGPTTGVSSSSIICISGCFPLSADLENNLSGTSPKRPEGRAVLVRFVCGGVG